MLYSVLVGVELLISILLVVLILLNRSKGSLMGGGFTGSSSSLFGSAGPVSFVTKIIAVLAVAFFVNSMALTFVANRDFTASSVIGKDEGFPSSLDFDTLAPEELEEQMEGGIPTLPDEQTLHPENP